jgi:hypothetical protein
MGKRYRARVSEATIQQHIVATFSVLSRQHNFLFFHVPNEAAMKGRKGKSLYALIAHLKKMGLVPGVSDLIIGHEGRMYFMEVKTETGVMSENQRHFQDWAMRCRMPYAIVRSAENAVSALKTWGIT